MNYWIISTDKWLEANRNKLLGECSIMSADGVSILYTRDGRFEADQLYSASDGGFIASDGVILNLSELKSKYNTHNLAGVIKCSDERLGESFFSDFVGPFSGARIKNGVITVWCNQTGDAPVFYYDGEFFSASDDFNLIIRQLKLHGIEYSFDENAALAVMTFGYQIDGSTMVSEIKRLEPGKYIRRENGCSEIKQYHRFSFDELNISFDEAVNEIDRGFRAALKRCFDKDIEYGYAHMADMSAGLDTRMVNWVAKEMGYGEISNFHYSQSCSDERRYAEAVSLRLGNNFMAMPLDNVKFIYDIDKLIHMNYGLTVYCGITGGERMLSCVGFERFGLEHTGQLENLTSYGNTDAHVPPITTDLRYTDTVSYKVPEKILARYENNEEFSYYTRGFLGTLSTHLIRRHYTYAVAPFIDRDFFELCARIPLRYRQNRRLYWQWLNRFYPEAAAMHSSRDPDRSLKNYYLYKFKRLAYGVYKKVLCGIGLSKTAQNPNGMNPFDYWYDTIPEMREFVHGYYSDTVSLLSGYPETLDRVKALIDSPKAMDKMLALTVLGAAKAYFSIEEQ